MRKILFISILLAITIVINAQTTVPAGNVSGTWNLSGSPYNVTGHIIVPAGDSLIIAPGVTVNFQGHYKLNVQGKIKAIGNIADTIIFTAANTTIGWWGIRFDSTSSTQDSSIIQYCLIQYGNANGTGEDACGGGIFIIGFSKIRIANSRIYNNIFIDYGGGIYCKNASPIITGNIIRKNTAPSGSGAGIYCKNSSPNITYNSILYNNTNSVAGIYCDNSSPNITYNIISNNTAFNVGGIYCDHSTPNIANNTISYNSSITSGGIACNYSSPNIINNTINNNSGGSSGGINCNYSSPNIIDNTISNNSYSSIYCLYSTPNITNNIISNNVNGISMRYSSPNIINNIISNSVNGIYCNTSSPNIINCTITNNMYTNYVTGGGLICSNSSNPVLKNVIIWGSIDTSGNYHNVYLQNNLSIPTFENCNIEGGSAGFFTNGYTYTGTYINNINSNPLFVSPSSGAGTNFNGAAADWSLQACSPCIDAGTTNITWLPSTDIAGNARISTTNIDIGAYEYQNPPSSSIIANSITANHSIVCIGQTTILSLLGGNLGTSANWYWYSGSCGGTIKGSGLTVSITPTITNNYYVRAEGLCYSTTCISKTIIVLTTCYSISGNFTYDDTLNTPLDSVWVYLLLNTFKVDSVQADLNGYYHFNYVLNGTYNITATTHKAWGGVNVTDAIKCKRHFAGAELLNSSIRLHAGDVDNSFLVNPTDAVKITKRYSGADTSFIRGDWVFEKPIGGDTINVSTYMNDTVIVNDANVVQDFKGLCVGDVNGSYNSIPVGQKSLFLKVRSEILELRSKRRK